MMALFPMNTPRTLFVSQAARATVALIAALGGLWTGPAVAATPAPGADLPRRLACTPDASHRHSLTLDPSGTPLGATIALTEGARECDLQTAGAPMPQSDGSWRFAWKDEGLGVDYRALVRRNGGGFQLSVQPAACGPLPLPSALTLSFADPSCKVEVDRHAAFVQFWRSVKRALADDDGPALVALALPRIDFVEGDMDVKAPASVLRGAAGCIPDVPAPVKRTDLRTLLAATDQPRLDMPPLVNRGDREVSVAGAMTVRWTDRGWRIQGFNASPAVMRDCRPHR